MKHTQKKIVFILICALCVNVGFVYAQTSDISDEINQLNQTIESKRQSIDQLNRQIDNYQSKIEEKQSEAATLSGELTLLENRAAKTELDIKVTNEEIDLVNSEIQVLESQITDLQTQLDREKEMISNILQKIQVLDNDLPLQTFLGTDSFAELFTEIEHLQTINGDLKSSLENAQVAKDELLVQRTNQQEKRNRLVDLEEELKHQQILLDEEKASKVVLLDTVQQSETEFQLLLNQLDQEQTYINQQITLLQSEIEGKLNQTDAIGDSSVLTWPIDPTVRGISAFFHDPTYPFRHLFEHSGIDLPAPTGTIVESAAPGYVAWARQGTLYGNYVMIIHTNGIATLYAHLSRMDVSADQFVTRGQSIGAVGSTGFSTGPHLHFEVRKNGIPTNPIDYLISF